MKHPRCHIPKTGAKKVPRDCVYDYNSQSLTDGGWHLKEDALRPAGTLSDATVSLTVGQGARDSGGNVNVAA